MSYICYSEQLQDVSLDAKEYNKILSKNFLLECLLINRSRTHQLEAQPFHSHIKQIFLKYVDDMLVQHYNDILSDATNFKLVINAIYSAAINTLINSFPVNGVIDVQTPCNADNEF